MNYVGETNVFDISTGEKSAGLFFGQSSFSNLSIVKKTSLVNVSNIVKSEEELKLFAPLGCGIQTGAGTVDNLAGASPKDAVVILGLGGVGLAAIMVSYSGERFVGFLLTHNHRQRRSRAARLSLELTYSRND
jgi:Zn-dependent alcohol dehydrogenase